MSQVEFDPEYQILIITPTCLPEADEFELWSSIFLHHPQHIQIIEFAQGADRHQLRFSYAQQSFNLNFEHYSESIWIAPEGQDAAPFLPKLAQLFLSNS
ncbi:MULTISPECIES: DUF3630 family protein [Pseudoalteromonas]|uniref:DUF3630 domain-containing protein n=1 Tax=Pseudoalteromonas amylolytica TaxID=1859457 RepID=A0A1S1MXK7_9GAMM|nr:MULTISPECIES: DUF3630 family protein [Pseudoalteromonas]OHU89036.1 hypothetical protein BFC16_05145 [Pseudoalteromonas sp. JW3]OHU91936.1 hypothetical protein BET10_06250 [Pseudoalteromonas amylolytica]